MILHVGDVVAAKHDLDVLEDGTKTVLFNVPADTKGEIISLADGRLKIEVKFKGFRTPVWFRGPRYLDN